jgi:hypothetical protein
LSERGAKPRRAKAWFIPYNLARRRLRAAIAGGQLTRAITASVFGD